ncbi:hypothetical protein [Pseudomonas sp. EMN2]|uniref:hypothetical protein n=1 Tax=Pseudomonas sp. EMN2 TaxID=2615212 RepID=UPI00129A23EB|nr:hypothetical protein [Pseudomonas sp. EMN2]
MTTEARSSNTDMISVQATIEALEEAHAGDGALVFMNDAAQFLRQFKDQAAEQHQGDLPIFANKVISKLKRFRDCAEDGQGADIGRQWFDTLVQLGLLHRVQRSPAMWEITCEGDALLEGHAGQEKKS